MQIASVLDGNIDHGLVCGAICWLSSRGSARVPRAGFGASPKQSPVEMEKIWKVRETRWPAPETRARPGSLAPAEQLEHRTLI